ncbi:MAG: RluA family pseudouridine synthase [Alphaproteobacteria bacterium]|nr:RluA family pseudouridine synthase [Alphaproteobacteria bacterium]
MSGVRHIQVKEDDNGQRLDRWLKKYVPELPYILAQKLMRTGQIRVDGKRTKPDMRLAGGQDIRIPPIEGEGRKSDRNAQKISDKDAQFIRSLVIYEDEDIIAINKPQGLAVQGGTGLKKHVDGMLDALTGPDGVRPRIVHRLDKDTSGVLLLARSADCARAMGRIFKTRGVRKIYWALVSPAPTTMDGTINAPLAKMGGPERESIGVNEEEGKPAITEFRVLEHAHRQAAFVAFWPRTGRTHQIRVHAALMGTPVIGDTKYGDRDVEHEHQIIGLDGIDLHKGLHLHARRILCAHPSGKGRLDITAPLSPELARSWKAMGFESNAKGDPFADVKS